MDHNSPADHPRPVANLERRAFLTGATLLGLAGAWGDGATRSARATSTDDAAATFHPIRPPATPLIVRGPYVSTWLAADSLPGTWPTFWRGNVTGLTGIARIDGLPYVFMGAPSGVGALMRQTRVEITATQSIFSFTAGGVDLTLTFLSPIEPDDLRRQSIPLAYIFAQARGGDGRPHTVSLYFDISAEWAHSDPSRLVDWSRAEIPYAGGALVSLRFALDSPSMLDLLAENADYPTWGQPVWATARTPALTTRIGRDTLVRAQAARHGALDGSIDPHMPRAIQDRWPVLGFNFALGTVGAEETPPITLALGHVRVPAVSYQGRPLAGLWQSYWPHADAMLAFFYADAMAARARAHALDGKIAAAATAAGGPSYAALCGVAVRQAFGATELVAGPAGEPWLLLKEISSDGNVSTVDVLYPSFPIYLYLQPALLRALLTPVLAYCESGRWPQPFCVHDLGSAYPNADGHNDGGGENMPVEETANMLLMAAAYCRYAEATAAASFAARHYPIFRQWAGYLLAPNGARPSRPNALDPLLQNQTDDFTGFIAHGTNLALKGILAIGAMAIIARAAGHGQDAGHYTRAAADLIPRWTSLAHDPGARHQMIAYDERDTLPRTGKGSWSLKYNAFPDALLGLHLVPQSVLRDEATWYARQAQDYGIPLDSRHTYTKADWEIWTAAGMRDPLLARRIIDLVYTFAHTTPSRVPFTDWYDTVSGVQQGFQARPVVGGLFALLLLGMRPRQAS